jgi:hypothetical protein
VMVPNSAPSPNAMVMLLADSSNCLAVMPGSCWQWQGGATNEECQCLSFFSFFFFGSDLRGRKKWWLAISGTAS